MPRQSSMRYALIPEVGKLELKVKEIPDVAPGTVLVKVEACGICGTDLHIHSGTFLRNLPYSPGHEFTGTVSAAGTGVTHVRPGDRVAVDPNCSCDTCFYCLRAQPHLCENLKTRNIKSNGGFADYVLAAAGAVHLLPANLSPEAATLTEVLSCALHAVDLAQVRPGSLACVLGGGAMGLSIVQLLRHFGAGRIVISEPVGSKRKLALSIGADVAVDPAEQEIETVAKSLQPQGADAVIECVGSGLTAQAAERCVRRGGIMVMSGLAREEEKLTLSPLRLVRDEITVRGAFLNPFSFARALELLASGDFQVTGFVSARFNLARIAEAFEHARNPDSVRVLVSP